MTFPKVQLMSAPSTSATVLYDFNAPMVGGGDVRILHNSGFDLGSSALEGEPDGIEVEYGLRVVAFTQQINGTRSNAMARQSAMARALMLRPEGWLLIQLSADRDPVWFHVYRPDLSAPSFDNVTDSDQPDSWNIPVQLPAEALAYGARVTHGAVTVNNDPAAGSNPCSFTLTSIVGDAPAPCRVEINPNAAAAMPGYRWMLAHAALDAAYTPVLWPVGTGDGFTAGTDTGAGVADALYTGGSYRAVTFATATMATRLSGSAPVTPTRGRYKVLVRIARSDTDSTFSMRFGQSVGVANIYGDIVRMDRAASTGSGHATWVDLGQFNFPRGSGQVPDDYSVTVSAPSIALQMARDSGSGSGRIDAFMLVPADIQGQYRSSVMFSEFTRIGIDSGSGTGIWDGDAETYWQLSQFGTLNTPMPVNMGGYPKLVPGATNVMHILQQVNGARPFFSEDAADVIAATSSVVVSYYPRYQWLGDG